MDPRFLPGSLWLAAGAILCSIAPASLEAQTIPRDFDLPVPVFSPASPWNQRCDTAAVLPASEQQILTLYRILLGDTTHLHPAGQGHPNPPWPYMDVGYDEFTMPIFRMGTGQATVLMEDYEGNPGGNNPKFPQTPSVSVPAPIGMIRPAAPAGADSDGHVVLFEPQTLLIYDYWQATTVVGAGGGTPGTAILRAGTIDFFDGHGTGVNPDTYWSARACGTPLIAGLLTPEDVESGVIAHALAFATINPRNLSTNPFQPLTTDYHIPCSTTETDFYSTNPLALAAGQRIRLRQVLHDEHGNGIVESALAPITQMYLACLRTHGAYLVDAAGGFSFYAEDIHTAVLDMTDDQVNQLIGSAPGTPLAPGKTKWEIAMETLNLELESIPLADGTWTPWDPVPDPSSAVIHWANFEVVEPYSPAGGEALVFQ